MTFSSEFICEVYPRVCGGSMPRKPAVHAAPGLSPRVRGKPEISSQSIANQGSIPACAGEAFAGMGRGRLAEVYPRVCGGSQLCKPRFRQVEGLSPRVRGKRPYPARCSCPTRSIPACAGEARALAADASSDRVYPRVCRGSEVAHPAEQVQPGLSPRVRGKHEQHGGKHRRRGSIPACAGEAAGAQGSGGQCQVYPRVCGGSSPNVPPKPPPRGLSPRVRGKRQKACQQICSLRSIPACAGEAELRTHQPLPRWVYPRVCGGSTASSVSASDGRGLSPRVRGKLRWLSVLRRPARSIPACAGEAVELPMRLRDDGVYPRVCGGSLW